MPRDRDASFEPKIVAKRQRRLTGYSRDFPVREGLTLGRSPRTWPRSTAPRSPTDDHHITDRVMDGMADGRACHSTRYTPSCSSMPLRQIREGQVATAPLPRPRRHRRWRRDVLGLWAGEHGDGEAPVLAAGPLGDQEPRHAGCVLLVCDGLKACPMLSPSGRRRSCTCSCISCVIHSSTHRRDWAHRRPQPVYTAASEAEALDRSQSSPVNGRNATPLSYGCGRTRGRFVPFLQFDRE